MADQVTVDNGEGTDYTVSTDDAGASGHVQRVKLALSADGSAAHATVDADGVLVNLGTNNDVTVTSSALPSGAATAAKQPALGTAGTPSADVISVQGTSAGTALPVSATALPLPTGAATAAAQATIAGHVDGIETLIGTTNTKLDTIDGRVDGVEALLGTIDADTSALAGAIAGTELQVDVLTLPALPAGTNNIGDVDVASMPKATTVVDVSLASSASSQQLLAANTGRTGLLLRNTDANTAYIYYGTTATTAKGIAIPSGAYWEMPQPAYAGRIDAIWAADGSGSLIGHELAA